MSKFLFYNKFKKEDDYDLKESLLESIFRQKANQKNRFNKFNGKITKEFDAVIAGFYTFKNIKRPYMISKPNFFFKDDLSKTLKDEFEEFSNSSKYKGVDNVRIFNQFILNEEQTKTLIDLLVSSMPTFQKEELKNVEQTSYSAQKTLTQPQKHQNSHIGLSLTGQQCNISQEQQKDCQIIKEQQNTNFDPQIFQYHQKYNACLPLCQSTQRTSSSSHPNDCNMQNFDQKNKFEDDKQKYFLTNKINDNLYFKNNNQYQPSIEFEIQTTQQEFIQNSIQNQSELNKLNFQSSKQQNNLTLLQQNNFKNQNNCIQNKQNYQNEIYQNIYQPQIQLNENNYQKPIQANNQTLMSQQSNKIQNQNDYEYLALSSSTNINTQNHQKNGIEISQTFNNSNHKNDNQTERQQAHNTQPISAQFNNNCDKFIKNSQQNAYQQSDKESTQLGKRHFENQRMRRKAQENKQKIKDQEKQFEKIQLRMQKLEQIIQDGRLYNIQNEASKNISNDTTQNNQAEFEDKNKKKRRHDISSDSLSDD